MHANLKDLGRNVVQESGLQRCISPKRENMKIDDLLQLYSSVITKVRGIRMLPSAYKGNEDFKYYVSLRSKLPWFKRRIHELLLNRLTKLYCTPAISSRELQLLYTEDSLLKHILRRIYLPNLIWLRWFKCPYSSLPTWIPMENLRVLHAEGSALKTLWHGKAQAPLQLRELEISASLLKIPKSIGKLKHLEKIYVSFSFSSKIETLPKEFCDLLSLKRLELVEARNIKSLPDAFGNLRNLEHIRLSDASSLESLPNSFGNLIRLQYLALTGARRIALLQDSFGNLRNLEHINLSDAWSLTQLPNSLENLIQLKDLNLHNCYSLTISNGTLAKIHTLRFLNLYVSYGSKLEPSLQLPRSLEELYIKAEVMPTIAGNLSNLDHLELELDRGRDLMYMLPPLLTDLRNLKELKLKSCKELNRLPDSVGRLTQLAKLEVDLCNDVVELRRLPGTLVTLRLSRCSNLRELGGLFGLAKLQALEIRSCDEVEELPSIETLVSLEELSANGCVKLKRIRGLAQLTKLRYLSVSGCRELKELAGIEQVRSLEILDASGCPELRWDGRVLEQLPQRLREGMLVI